MPAIEFRRLTKQFGQLAAIETLDLQIDHGDRVAIVGPSGAGKSTLLRVLAGLEAPDTGQVFIDGTDMTRASPERRGLAFMSQDYALYPQLDVRQNLETALLSLKLSRAQRRQRSDEVLHWFRIEHLSARLPSQLSGGQSQRVALAKAIVRRPQILILDEPLSQLDCLLREELLGLIAATVEHGQMTLMYVTHDPLEALRLSNKVAVLVAGRLRQFDTPTSIYHSPTCREAAELTSLWGVNWLSAEGLQPCQPSPLVAQVTAAIAAGQSVGFRPEGGQLHDSQPDFEQALALPVTVGQSHFLGIAHLISLATATERFQCLSQASMASQQPAWLVVPARALIYCAQKGPLLVGGRTPPGA